MLSGSLSFALMSIIARDLASTCDWQVIALARTFLAMVFAAGLAWAAGVRLVICGSVTLWVRSVAGSLSLVGTFYAYTRLPVAEVLTLTSLFPIWVALLAWPVFNEPPPGKVWASLVLSIAGIYLIQQPHFAEGNLAAAVAVAGSFSTAVAMMGLHRLRHLDPRAIVVHFSAVALLFCLATFVLFDHLPNPLGRLGAWPLVELLGIGVTATVGQLLLTKAFAAGPAAQVSLVALTQVVFAGILSALLLQETLEPVTLVGMSLVVGPTAWLMARG